MKALYLAIVMVLLVGLMVPTPVKADGVTNISGIVTDESTGYPIDDVELAFENLRTLEVVYEQTDANGYYYKSLSSFAQGWISGDDVEITADAEGFNQYVTVYSLESSWPTPDLDVNPRMTPRITGGDVDTPDFEGLYSIAFLCTGGSGSYNYGTVEGYKYPSNDYTYKPDAGTDGVEVQSYIRVQDDGSWVSQGTTYRIRSTSWLKIEKNVGQHVYYDSHIHLTDNDNNEYYDVSHDSAVTIDPCHDTQLPKDGTYGIDGVKLKVSITYDIDVDDITGGGCSHYYSGSWPYVKYITYDWDA